jgi:hypothetical protein
MTGILLVHVPVGHSSQLSIDDRHELLQRCSVAVAPLDEQLSDVVRRRVFSTT